ncbi:hypothetical protein BKH43_05900 [Helicobacter sp. 13S00401-1]|uniref:Bax inhibitor-1/YccA family protein n=1 Tax=Helicobacter sp. 13S00401-1 TaxID=1905758 RepID=UPI000BA519DD|nr:Bax inhibitor-1/YccA family protein [Helicobacter sp. 13S00401-1]PAF50141.1 hypothetical protein BKH43_05900 [Helicobacter sp. 13S00401-1]
MGLYNRNYARDTQKEAASAQSDTALVNFVKTTYKFFAASLLLATIGAFIGIYHVNFVVSFRWPIFILEIVSLIALMFLKDRRGINIALLAIFTFLSGLTLVPLLAFVISVNGLSGVVQALAMTTIIFGIMSVYAIKTPRDLANLGRVLLISVIVVIVVSLLNMFWLKSSMLQLGIAGIATIIFSVYIAYDTQNIIKGRYSSPIMAAIALYLDFLNVFVSLLQIFGILGSNNR